MGWSSRSCRRPRETGQRNKKERISTPASNRAAISRSVPLAIVWTDLPLGLSRPREASMRSVCTGRGNTRPRPVAADRAVDPPVVKLILRSPSMKAYLPVGPIAHFCWPRRTL